ncbi:two-component regulator propeller domain-containing protein [Cytophagaceae bacterium YF14B1]|uniref:Two-component regulator propeller domain-containing protein n=1 Tax=Xanthocytophaga flava TaxID=3048013 RepID=A0AAE3QRN7_9BACT|nr:two-component regulator propeller domain-containing protein [Xanthocytophaga flavus]MDJ1484222.1 two-component regulator propeller domain-containing protein [Xanthocytophaga flavus]
MISKEHLFNYLQKRRTLSLLRFIGMLFSIIYIPKIVFSQEPVNMYFSQLNTASGLSQNYVYKIGQDHEGFMWFGTQLGIDMYDGILFKSLKLPGKKLNQLITLIFDDYENQRIIVGTEDATYFLDISERSELFNDPQKIIVNSNLRNLKGVFYKKNSLVLFTENKIISSEDTISFPNIKINNVKSLSEQYFVLATDIGVYLYSLGEKQPTLLERTNNMPVSILEYDSSKNELLLCTQKILSNGYENSVLVYSLKSKTLTRTMFSVRKPYFERFSSLILTKDKNLFVGTENSGLYVVNSSTSNLLLNDDCDNTTNCIANRKILSLFESNDNVIWVGTRGEGINMLSKSKQQFYGNRKLNQQKKSIWTIQPILNSNKIFLGVESEGLWLLDIKNDSLVQINSDYKRLSVYCLNWINNKLYGGTSSGLFRFNKNKKFERILISDLSNKDKVYSFFFDERTKNWWLGIEDGLSKKGKIFILNYKFQVIRKIFLEEKTTFYQIKKFSSFQKESILIAGTNGLIEFELSKNSQINFVYKRLLNKQTMCIHFESNSQTLWLGTAEGLEKLDLRSGKLVNFDRRGLPSDIIYGILEDNNGNFWMSSNHGIYKYNLREDIICTYNRYSVLPSNEFNARAFVKGHISEREIFYFGGLGGILWFYNSDIASKSLGELFYSIKLNYPDDGINEKYLAKIYNKAKVPYNFSFITVTPSVLDFNDFQNNQFRYRVGNEKAWNYIESGKEVNFTLVPAQIKRSLWWDKNTNIYFQFRKSNRRWEIDEREISISVHAKVPIYVRIFLLLLFLYLFWRISNNLNSYSRLKDQSIFKFSTKNYSLLFYLNIAWYGVDSFMKDLIERDNLNKLINNISRFNLEHSNASLFWEQVYKDISQIAPFAEYVAIYLIDFKLWEISTKDIYPKNGYLSEEDRQRWTKEKFYLNDKNILVQIVKGLKIIRIVNRDISFKDDEHTYTDIKSENLDSDLFVSLKQEKFGRVFIPLIQKNSYKHFLLNRDSNRLESERKNSDTPIGLIEIGLIEKNQLSNNRITKIKKDIKRCEGNLQAYLDNVAQIYYPYLLENILLEESKRILRDYFKESPSKGNILNKYFNHILEQFSVNIKPISSVLICLSSLDYKIPELNILKNQVLKFEDINIQILVDKQIDNVNYEEYREIIANVISTKEGFYIDSMSNIRLFLFKDSNIASVLAIPLKSNSVLADEILGVIIFESFLPDYFNDLYKAFFENISKFIADRYLIEKKQKAQNELLSISNFRNIYEQDEFAFQNYVLVKVGNLLSQYFLTTNICIWHKNPSERNFKLIYWNENELLREICVQNNLLEREYIEVSKDIEKGKGIKKTDIIYSKYKEWGFEDCLKISVKVNKNYTSVIYVFSVVIVPFHQDIEYLCAFIGDAITVSFQEKTLDNALTELVKIGTTLLSDSFSSTKESLQAIADVSVKVLQADLVTIFQSQNTEEPIRLKDAVYSGSLFPEGDSKAANPEREANIANIIKKRGTHIIGSEDEYVRLLRLHKKNTQPNFWNTNKIELSVAFRLEYEKQILGVMFFNFKRKIDLREKQNETWNLLEKYVAFVKLIILSQIKITEIRNNLDNLNIDRKNWMKAKDELEKQYSEIERINLELKNTIVDRSYLKLIADIYHIISHETNHLLTDHMNGLGSLRLPTQVTASIEQILLNQLDFVTSTMAIISFDEWEADETFNINEAVSDVVTFFSAKFRRSKNIIFETSLQRGLEKEPITCFKPAFNIILFNIINNAIDAINQKLGNKSVPFQGKIKVRTNVISGKYLITIDDNGCGIDNKIGETIFDYKVTTKRDGNGLGLFFVRSYLNTIFSGGKIRYENLLNTEYRTRFAIEIPLKKW